GIIQGSTATAMAPVTQYATRTRTHRRRGASREVAWSEVSGGWPCVMALTLALIHRWAVVRWAIGRVRRSRPKSRSSRSVAAVHRVAAASLMGLLAVVEVAGQAGVALGDGLVEAGDGDVLAFGLVLGGDRVQGGDGRGVPDVGLGHV